MKSRMVYRWGFVVLGFSAVVNLIVAVRVFFAMQHPVEYNIRVIEPPIYTNVVASLPSFPPMPGVETNEAPQTLDVSPDFAITNHFEVAAETYHYMRIDDRPCFRLNGRNYSAGDVTAFGTVRQIYPERVYFDDGGYISNLRRVFDVVGLAPTSPAVVPERRPQIQPREESPHDAS